MPGISGLSENKIAAMLLRRVKMDYKDREYDSDDDLRKEMMTYDDRLTFVNKLDFKLFNTDQQQDADKEKKEKTAAVEVKIDEDAE